MDWRRFMAPAMCVVMLTAAWVWAQEQRVEFPKDYQKEFRIYHTMNNEERKSLREMWINPAGGEVASGGSFPYGTVILMLGYRPKMENGQPVRDAAGLFVKDTLTRIDVMRKENGFGALYGDKRSGEWEYNAFRPNGEIIKGKTDNSRCAACHQDAEATDFVFTAEKLTKK